MQIWQADFYKHSPPERKENPLWSLIICDEAGKIIQEVTCPQSAANPDWLVSQIQPLIEPSSPVVIAVFRPQSIGLFTAAAEKLGIRVEATRHTPALKKLLQAKYGSLAYNPIRVEQSAPQSLPENLWGEKWQFATFPASEIVEFFRDRPIPILDIPSNLSPNNLGIASTVKLPGVIIYGDKKSMYLARWLADIKPYSLNYIPTEIERSGGLVLEAGLADRWILATFEDSIVAQAATHYEQRKQASKGLHFLIVQPDDSGMTYSGVWLLQQDELSS